MEKELITVIVPCYNEEEVLPLFHTEILRVSKEMSEKNPGLEFEFLFIDDGSKDGTLDILRKYSAEDKRFRYISFSRNFGKEAGMLAGMEHSKGDYVVIMDADLQHPPSFLPEMYEYVSSGEYDCASTQRTSRKGEPKLLSFFARSFYKVINKISQTHITESTSDFRFMTRQMVDAILSMQEYNRFSKGIFSWVGFRTKYIEYENVERAAGKTTWSFWKLLLYSFEGITAFSTAPLYLAVIMGLVFLLLAILVALKTLICGEEMWGTPLVVTLICLVGGIQLFCMGILGQYLAKTYMEVKNRPKYIIGETERETPRGVSPPRRSKE
ncbi:MAG: glycosyltransferase family 2 protein [Oscillospiraceae bacterium]|jgi:glycosyltransferase involved in cell wall biosynthesis|nr:glycosyltransferase family 2 protein [Oscillospiraceae bacterium]